MSTSYEIFCEAHQGEPAPFQAWPTEGAPSYLREQLWLLIDHRTELVRLSELDLGGHAEVVVEVLGADSLQTLPSFMCDHRDCALAVRDEYHRAFDRPEL